MLGLQGQVGADPCAWGFPALGHCGPHYLCLPVEPSCSGQALKDAGEMGLDVEA